jgi:cell division protease FtsH
MSNTPVKYPKRKKTSKPPVRSSDSNGNTPGSGSPTNGGNENTNWRFFGFIGASVLLFLVSYHLISNQSAPIKDMAWPEVEKLAVEGRLQEVAFVYEPSKALTYLQGTYQYPKNDKDPTLVVGKFKAQISNEFYGQGTIYQILVKNGKKDIPTLIVDNSWWISLVNLLPIVLLIAFIYFIFRQQIRMAGKSAFSFGKSKAKMLSRDRNRVTFKDVAGVDEAKEEVQEIVEFLKDPKRFQKLGGRIPKGVLMVGPPGTGKTLLAKAIAGEADVPFFSISGSDFVEMFVGVGASRVRDMFEQGRKHAPCLIFIDEIDAVGRSRGTGMGGGHDEREQTLNAMLVEMDGIDTQEGVIIIAATNRKDVLDPALLRPGRFDREVRVNLPDVKGREQILQVHAKNVKLGKEVDLGILARGTPGFSGAELANVVNEAALLAAKYNKDFIAQAELEEARDKVRWGRERRSMAMSEEEKKTTAYHEAGHALLNVVLEHTDPLHKVSIIPRGPALGVTMMLPLKDKYNARQKEVLDDLVVTMGGRVAEEIFLGDISSGAAGDIHMATFYAKKMVCEWGMSPTLGMVQYGEDPSMTFLGRDLGATRHYSEATAQEIDKEVFRITDTAYRKAKELILEHRDKIEIITQALLEYETLDGVHITDIVKHGKMLNPPPKPLEPPTTPLPKETLPPNPVEEKKDDDGGLLPGLQGAPAGA